MVFNENVLNTMERIVFSLRSLYRKHGYMPYKMSKFEEYDLYARNKDFLISDNIITFTDRNGKLMALKPDVTLSIVKNTTDMAGITEKVYYDENVYRVMKNDSAFREILQTGLECIGEVDDYCIGEVLYLAAESLREIGKDFVLDISQMDIVSALIEQMTPMKNVQDDIFKCIGEKNPHGILEICKNNEISEEAAAPIIKLIGISGKPREVLPEIEELAAANGLEAQAEALKKALTVFTGTFSENAVRIDFSVVSDRNYYNGITFNGFVEGVPGSVLSGGQYDKLMKKMGRKSHAIGFAVYLDMLERISGEKREFDADLMLLYDENTDRTVLRAVVDREIAAGRTVLTGHHADPRLSFRKIAKMVGSEVQEL